MFTVQINFGVIWHFVLSFQAVRNGSSRRPYVLRQMFIHLFICYFATWTPSSVSQSPWNFATWSISGPKINLGALP